MQIEIQDPYFQTVLYSCALIATILITVYRKAKDEPLFPPGLTQELKGLAILTIIFGHIGYFLDKNDTYLYPLSIASGVGVNLFLFLSGYGLTKSSLKKPLPLLTFYKKRLSRLFIPMWIVLAILLTLDWLILGKTYDQKSVIQNLFGFFPVADIYTSLNSVLWYFTFILFYYLIYPLFTISKKLLLFSPLIIYLLSIYLLKQELPINRDVITLYTLHTFAFPLGIAAANLPHYLKHVPRGNSILNSVTQKIKNLSFIFTLLLLCIFGWVFYYTAVNSKIGESKTGEQVLSNITMFAAIGFFAVKKIRSKFLEVLGNYSYEIYLIHWPLAYRYDVLYQNLPAALATIIYILILLVLGWGLQKITELLVIKLKL